MQLYDKDLLSVQEVREMVERAKAAQQELAGEVLRVHVLADSDGIATLVFDEIDSGVSGQIGNAVAQKMRQIACTRQVLCITHLPQIAACAQAQYHVFKQEMDGKTVSSIVRLDDEGRCRELARIMGSRADDPVALRHARQLLDDASVGVNG